MSIRPIDMQMMVHKASDVNKVAIEAQKTDGQQQMFSDQLQKQVEHESQQIIQTNKSEEESIKDDNRKNKQKYNKNNASGKKKKNLKENKKQDSTSMFDVSI